MHTVCSMMVCACMMAQAWQLYLALHWRHQYILSAADAFGTSLQSACLLWWTKLLFGRFLHAGMSRCGVQMSLRCAEVAPGAKPSVEGHDGADWCVVDAGKPLYFLLIKLACITVLQPLLTCCRAHALARARAYQNVLSGFLPDEYALRLTREGTHYHCALVGASQHQANFL